jgi:hypothetical protein
MSLTICLSPQEVERRLAKMAIHGAFSERERIFLATTPIVEGGERLFGFPTPAANSGLTLASIMTCVGTDPQHQPSFFDHPWYQSEAFMNEPCPAGWHFLHMDVLPDSVGQPIDYARSFSGRGLSLPAAIEVVLMLFLHYVDSGEQLLAKKHTWCAERASLDRRVTVGAFGRNGVFLSSHPENFASRGLGICPRIEF